MKVFGEGWVANVFSKTAMIMMDQPTVLITRDDLLERIKYSRG